MKKLTLILAMVASAIVLSAAEPLALPKPAIADTATLGSALQNRKSTRDFSDQELSCQQIANLLWAGYGINRAEGAMRTVPAAMNRHAFTLYLLTKKGAARYDETANTLIPVTEKDLRVYAEGRGTLGPAAGAVILLVAHTDIYSPEGGRAAVWLGVEAGAICQDIYLYAASEELNALCCGSLNAKALAEGLALPKNREPLLTMIVGAPNKK